MNFGTTELLIVLGIVLLLFGAPRLPKLARSMGRASKEFKAGVAEGPEGDDRPDSRKPEAVEESNKPASPSAS